MKNLVIIKINRNKKEEFNIEEKVRLIKNNYILIKKLNNFLILFKLVIIKYIVLIAFLFIIILDIIYKNTNIINIAMSLNNDYTYPIMVSMTSILLNSNKNTSIHFHILKGNDVDIENQNKILSLKHINKNTNFTFYDVGNRFNGWIHGKKKITVAGFYRSIIGELIKNVDKIIYLDGDTLIYGDLYEMYQINMDNLYFRGIREILPSYYKPVINSSRFICDGVMLMNLKLIREDHFYETFRDYYLKFYNKRIYFGDQHIINTLFRDKIDFLPPKFGIWFMTEENFKEYNSLNPLIYTIDELREANNKPIIRHLWGKTQEGIDLLEKPWLFNKPCKIKEEWKYYANKTGYYESICKFFKNACLN